jgi:hypothetical protein
VSWWPGAGNANDIVGNNSGTLQNGVGFPPGKVGQGFGFDGVDDYVVIPDSANLSVAGALSIEAWIRPAQVTDGTILAKYDFSQPAGASYWFGTRSSGKLEFAVYNTPASYLGVDSQGAVLSANQWQHVAATFSPVTQTTKVYLNGQELPVVYIGTANVTTIPDNAVPVTLGAYVSGAAQSFFAGQIDEVTLYNRELTASEIQAIYNAHSAGKCLTPLYITAVNRSGNNVNLSWQAQRGLTYRVQYTTRLGPGASWNNVAGDVTATGSSASKTDVLPSPNPASRFYRVEMFR